MKKSLALLVLLFASSLSPQAFSCIDELSLQSLVPTGFALVDLALALEGNDSIARQVVRLGDALDEEGIVSGEGGLVRFDEPELFEILELDRRTHFSQVVLNDEDRVAGFLLAHFDSRWREVRISKLGLLPEYRRRGFATLMLTATALRAKQHEKQTLSLNVFSTNLSAISLYQNLGFWHLSSHPSLERPNALFHEMRGFPAHVLVKGDGKLRGNK